MYIPGNYSHNALPFLLEGRYGLLPVFASRRNQPQLRISVGDIPRSVRAQGGEELLRAS